MRVVRKGRRTSWLGVFAVNKFNFSPDKWQCQSIAPSRSAGKPQKTLAVEQRYNLIEQLGWQLTNSGCHE